MFTYNLEICLNIRPNIVPNAKFSANTVKWIWITKAWLSTKTFAAVAQTPAPYAVATSSSETRPGTKRASASTRRSNRRSQTRWRPRCCPPCLQTRGRRTRSGSGRLTRQRLSTSSKSCLTSFLEQGTGAPLRQEGAGMPGIWGGHSQRKLTATGSIGKTMTASRTWWQKTGREA